MLDFRSTSSIENLGNTEISETGKYFKTESISKQQRFLYKTVHQNAQLACDFPAHRETITKLNAYLLKGVEKEQLFEANWNNSTTLIKIKTSGLSLDINITKEEKHAMFHLRDLQVSHTDSYMCKIEVIDPPPYETESRSNLIYVQELPQCQEKLDYVNMPMAIPLGFFVFYSMIITAAIYYCWLKSKKNRVLQNDYFNMTPWQSNGPRKRPPQHGIPTRNYTAYRYWEP
ncbi:T-cell-specific surface glycoprotein CD28 [Protobothrops mucrosquamatus]|uniref:T-cell-specific surface glycoprotein CD28 n=1 Tax=Protobothrops mucrosquamatus TaxID=103944 RepID=UPI0010FB044D|nr:T-cell-specific surface glycoprotein CD28 [Protobothrops mucrosquamatus]